MEIVLGLLYYKIRQDQLDRVKFLQKEFHYPQYPIPPEVLHKAKYFLEFAEAVYGFFKGHQDVVKFQPDDTVPKFPLIFLENSRRK